MEFIKAWERIAVSEEIKGNFSVNSTSEWMIFNDRKGLDFYAKSYDVSGAKVLIAYDPSETGREIFIGNGPPITSIMSASAGKLNTSFLGETPTPKVTTVELPLVGGTSTSSSVTEKPSTISSTIGSKNCSDFDNQRDAIAYFRENGFGANYDPYGLDADNNGIPCESFSRSSGVPSTTASKCPTGKTWVSAYTRKDGRRVRGHCRTRR